MRLLLAPLDRGELTDRLGPLMDALAARIPRGMGPGGVWWLESPAQLLKILEGGSRFAVAQGHGVEADLDRCEDRGVVIEADPAAVSERALARGLRQVGSLGSGNHFLEVQAVDEIFDETAAEALGLYPGRVCVMIHCGSRGLGHQICSDHVRSMLEAMPRYGITVPDQQLACVPVGSPEGRAYLGAMAAAANYGRANRQLLSEAARDAFAATIGLRDLQLLYDVSHNLAKLETHPVDGQPGRLCVHRKGATLALPPEHGDLPGDLRGTGQPVLVPGSMGTATTSSSAWKAGPRYTPPATGPGGS